MSPQAPVGQGRLILPPERRPPVRRCRPILLRERRVGDRRSTRLAHFGGSIKMRASDSASRGSAPEGKKSRKLPQRTWVR